MYDIKSDNNILQQQYDPLSFSIDTSTTDDSVYFENDSIFSFYSSNLRPSCSCC